MADDGLIRMQILEVGQELHGSIRNPDGTTAPYSHTYTEAEADELVAGYDPVNGHEAPLSVDHRHDGPAYGFVKRIWREGKRVFAAVKATTDAVREAIASGAYAKVSPELSVTNPLRLQRVDLLGAKIPAGKGYAPIHLAAPTAAVVCLDMGMDGTMVYAPADLADEIAAEDTQRWIDRVMDKVWFALQRCWSAVNLSAAQKLVEAQNVVQQAGPLLTQEPATAPIRRTGGDTSAPADMGMGGAGGDGGGRGDTGGGQATSYAEETDMTKEEMTAAFAEAMKPLVEKIAVLETRAATAETRASEAVAASAALQAAALHSRVATFAGDPELTLWIKVAPEKKAAFAALCAGLSALDVQVPDGKGGVTKQNALELVESLAAGALPEPPQAAFSLATVGASGVQLSEANAQDIGERAAVYIERQKAAGRLVTAPEAVLAVLNGKEG